MGSDEEQQWGAEVLYQYVHGSISLKTSIMNGTSNMLKLPTGKIGKEL